MATKSDIWCSFLTLLLFQIVSCAVDVHKDYLERYPKCGTLEEEGPARIVNGYSVKQKIPWVVHMGKMGKRSGTNKIKSHFTQKNELSQVAPVLS